MPEPTPGINPLQAIVKFGADVPVQARNEALLDFERNLRQLTGLRIEVFQAKRGDDSKPRNAMTIEQRAKL